MTVKELIAELSKLPQNWRVCIDEGRGGPVGEITQQYETVWLSIEPLSKS